MLYVISCSPQPSWEDVPGLSVPIMKLCAFDASALFLWKLLDHHRQRLVTEKHLLSAGSWCCLPPLEQSAPRDRYFSTHGIYFSSCSVTLLQHPVEPQVL